VTDQIIWWTGAVVLSLGAALAASLFVCGIVYLTSHIAWTASLRAGRTISDLRNMHTWVRAGKPMWYFEAGKPTQMRPTVSVSETER
jgi:hypothetical protein